MARHRPQRKSVSGLVGETIIGFQSGMLFLFGLAGFLATDAVITGFGFLKNKDSMVAFTTGEDLITDVGEVNLSGVEGMVSNFSLVCFVALTIGGIIFIATLIRLWKKTRSS